MRKVALPLVVATLLVAGALAAVAGPVGAHGTGPVGAHGNHLRADAQLSDDGSVVVETAFLLQDGYVAIHATDDEGRPAEVLAVRRVDSGFHSPMDIRLNSSFWARQNGSVRLWAVIHDDDGDGTFEPDGDDAALSSFGSLSGSRFVVGKAAGKASVVAASFTARRTTGEVTLPRVSLPADGYVALRDDDTGERAGHVALPAGTHENVTVSLSADYLRNASEKRQSFVRATVYRDDGDGEFDPATDSVVAVDGRTISSVFGIRVPESAAPDDGTTTPGGTSTATDGGATTTTTALVNTPSPTTTATRADTPDGSPTASTTTGAGTNGSDGSGDGTDAGAHGFGLVLAVLGLGAAAVLAVRRR